MELRPAEAKPSNEGWCGASPEVLVKRLIPGRIWSSHTLLPCLQSACPGPSSLLPTTGQPWGRCWHSFCFCSPLERADEETRRCLECCAEGMQMDFRILTVWFSHHQGCDEGSCWVTERQSFWWINHKFIHMPRAFLMATVSQPVMFLRNGGPVVITCGDTASDAFVPTFVREKDSLSCFLDLSK